MKNKIESTVLFSLWSKTQGESALIQCVADTIYINKWLRIAFIKYREIVVNKGSVISQVVQIRTRIVTKSVHLHSDSKTDEIRMR